MTILKLPISISNYIIISDALNLFPSKEMYGKLICDYIEYLPIYKVVEICIKAQKQLNESDFQYVLESLWKCVAISQTSGKRVKINECEK